MGNKHPAEEKLVRRRADKDGRGGRFVGEVEEEVPTLLPGSGQDIS